MYQLISYYFNRLYFTKIELFFIIFFQGFHEKNLIPTRSTKIVRISLIFIYFKLVRMLPPDIPYIRNFDKKWRSLLFEFSTLFFLRITRKLQLFKVTNKQCVCVLFLHWRYGYLLICNSSNAIKIQLHGNFPDNHLLMKSFFFIGCRNRWGRIVVLSTSAVYKLCHPNWTVLESESLEWDTIIHPGIHASIHWAIVWCHFLNH